MRYRKLHGTDIEISELGFGTWTVSTGWWGTYTDDEARTIIESAIDHGINLRNFDVVPYVEEAVTA